MDILVVGGAGYVGGGIVDLLSKKHDVTVYDSLIYENSFRKDVTFIFGDIRDYKKLNPILNNYDAVIWLAALVGDGACAINPTLTHEINAETVNNLTKNFKGKIVFLSTCSVYGAQDGILNEESSVNPLSEYASSKLIPIGFTLYLTKILIGISSNLIPKNINPNSYLPFNIPGVEIVISILLITIVGGLSLSFFGRRILKLIDDLFKRIPFLRTVYSAIVQMTETFSKKDDGKKSVVLIEYPRKGVWAVGFATKENKGEMAQKTNKKLINVFVPTTPNPTSGFLLMFPIDEVIYLNMTFEEASKFIVSAGTSTGKN